MRFYQSPTTQAIHIVQDWPAPKNKDATMCGQKLSKLNKVSVSTYYEKNYSHRQCLKCRQLAGMEG